MTRGKRVAPVSSRPDPRAAAARAAAMARARNVRGNVHGSREEVAPQPIIRRRKSKFLVQLVVSATLLLCVVAAKITMPHITEKYGDEVLRLMGEETDFVAAFSAAGRAIGGEEAGKAIEELCVAVFGSDAVEVSSTTVDRTDAIYSEGTTPERVEMRQQVLGFTYVCPVEGAVSSSFGYRDHPMAGQERFHYGLDLSAEEGAVIRSFADGTVLAVAESAELGKYVEVAHANGYTTLYAHCNRINASAGQSVQAGDPIAEVGDTGNTTGCHLHFELCCDGTYLNPVYYVV